MSFVEVAVKSPFNNSILTYSIEKDRNIVSGEIVEVPLGKRNTLGCILNTVELSGESVKIKPIGQEVNNEFNLSHKELELYKWMSKYYHYPLGQLIFDCLPSKLTNSRDKVFPEGQGKDFEHELNQYQAPVYQKIAESLFKGFSKHYIHGVTGSGKTLIYLNLMRDVLSKGKTVIFLVPEINLTPQFLETFSTFLNCPIYSYHSGITAAQKNVMWRKIKSEDRPCLIMGVRSSIFLPTENLGIVIVDEEHDQSFKQNDRCPYNGRDVAIKKSQISSCPVILGSATPTVENYKNYLDNNYYPMKTRVTGYLPEIKILDAREKTDKTIHLWPFQEESIDEITRALSRGEQVLVFVNRLGFANFVQCRACGHKFVDPNTDMPLKYFKKRNLLKSAYSDYEIPLPESCPECQNMNLLQKGFGTEKIQEVLRSLFPDKIIERFDRDEIKTTKKLEEKLNAFHSGEYDIFVGTQMLSKGHNFKRVNLVVMLGVDSQLNFPDFRAQEKTYQLLTQVAGRSGRYSKKSIVLIQSLSPENKIFDYIKNHSFDRFYVDELKIREMLDFPPYSKMAIIHFSCRFRDRVMADIGEQVFQINKFISKNSFSIELHGPVPASIERKSNQFNWCFALKSNDINELHQALSFFKRTYRPKSGVSFKVDVDPYLSL